MHVVGLGTYSSAVSDGMKAKGGHRGWVRPSTYVGPVTSCGLFSSPAKPGDCSMWRLEEAFQAL